MRETLIVLSAEYLVYLQALAAIVIVWLRRKVWRPFMSYALASGVLSFIISRIASALYDNPRPFVAGNFVPIISHSPDNGFPSDHTLLAAWLAAVVWPVNKKAGIALGIVAVLIGLARVAAGVHHMIDIVGSLVIVVVSAWLVWYTVAKRFPSAR